MGWFWATPTNAITVQGGSLPSKDMMSGDISLCPVMGHNNTSKDDSSACPVMHKDAENINPLNNMPFSISSDKHSTQRLELPKDRTISSIPRGSDPSQNWEYPSPQQMYNAMVRKGKIDQNTGEEIPEDAVESMVYVHNFLNEGSWEEILKWEKPYTEQNQTMPKLLKFTGRPDSLSPKARWHHFLSNIFPSKYSSELPFDRHDWVVLRGEPTSNYVENPGYKKVRYVLDYYGGPDDENGMPTFNIDVRPALDNFENAKDRFNHFTKPILRKYFDKDE